MSEEKQLYYEKLKDPRWIKKRKKIIKRDGGKCTVCNARKRLQVHHTYYYNQPTEPWCYPDDSLITVCKACHQDYHEHHENEYRDKPIPTIKKKSKKALFQKKKKIKRKTRFHYTDHRGRLINS